MESLQIQCLFQGVSNHKNSEYLFIGISVDEATGENYYNDATVAYRRACLNAITYLEEFGYSGDQAYLLLGSAPIEGPNLGCRRHPERMLFAVASPCDLRFRHPPDQGSPIMSDRGSAAATD